jgi:hypothetical protein
LNTIQAPQAQSHRPRRAHKPQHQRRDRQADQRADQTALDQITQPEAKAHLVETETLFEPERGPPAHRERQYRADQGERTDQGQLLPQAGAHQVQQPGVQRMQPAQQGPAQQQRGLDGRLQHAETGLGHRVVGRLAVGVQADGGCEGLGHPVAVAHDMAHLAAGEHGAHDETAHKKGAEEVGESEGGTVHGRESIEAAASCAGGGVLRHR